MGVGVGVEGEEERESEAMSMDECLASISSVVFTSSLSLFQVGFRVSKYSSVVQHKGVRV